MPRIEGPHVIQVVPKDGTLEITLNVNITVDGKLQETAKEVVNVGKSTEFLIPQFQSGQKIANFNKEQK
jgi:hypothetical protein